MKEALGHWQTTIPPPLKIPVCNTEWNQQYVDPIPGIFQQIAAIAATPIPKTGPPPPPGPPSSNSDEAAMDSDSRSERSSGWESTDSLEEGMDVELLPLDVDTGEATFATS